MVWKRYSLGEGSGVIAPAIENLVGGCMVSNGINEDVAVGGRRGDTYKIGLDGDCKRRSGAIIDRPNKLDNSYIFDLL